MNARADLTFSPDSRYGSERWVAAALGVKLAWLKDARPRLERECGFPPADPIFEATIKSDVDDWIAKRKRIALNARMKPSSGEPDYAKL